MKVKIRKGDTVEVISGRLEDKGKRGEVINVILDDRRVVVQGVNIRIKHQKQTQTQAGRNMNPGRIEFEGPIDISNVMLVCPKCNEATRVGVQRDDEGAHRVCKNCEATIAEAVEQINMNRMQELYNNEVSPALFKSFSLKNVMQVPRIEKVVINIGLGEAMDNPKALDAATADLMQITGQKPVQTKARKSIANFKLREGRLIGAKVTLRGPRMWAFIDRLINIALPRVRDFRGVSANAFDGRGNYTLGLKDQLVFPEIEYDKIDKLRGMEVTIVTSAKSDDQARALLKLLGMPFSSRKDA